MPSLRLSVSSLLLVILLLDTLAGADVLKCQCIWCPSMSCLKIAGLCHGKCSVTTSDCTWNEECTTSYASDLCTALCLSSNCLVGSYSCTKGSSGGGGSTSGSTSSGGGGSSLAVIVGAAVGGGVALIVIIAILVLHMRKKRGQVAAKKPETLDPKHEPFEHTYENVRQSVVMQTSSHL